MNRKFKIILLILSLSLTLSYMSNTYSRYVADATGNLEVLFAKWQILVNGQDIEDQTTSSIRLTPVIDANDNVAQGKIAPSSKGHFDIVINPENVDVSFEYAIQLAVLNENMPDIMVTKYSILDNDYVEGTTLDIEDSQNNEIIGSFDYTKGKKYETFIVRVYFEWYEGTNELMNDEADTAAVTALTDENDSLDIEAKIQFKQKL